MRLPSGLASGDLTIVVGLDSPNFPDNETNEVAPVTGEQWSPIWCPAGKFIPRLPCN